MDLSDLYDRPIENRLLHEATDRIMAAITAIVEDLRGERRPRAPFDPRKAGVPQTGNPHGPGPGPDERRPDANGPHR